MGLASGKLTLQHVEDKANKELSATDTHKAETVETASQLVNGDANAMNNVPAIDEVVEPVSAKPVSEARTEAIETVDEVSGPNGTVHSGEDSETREHDKKKAKNPFGWIKRRLSKKHSTSKSEQEAAAVAAAATTGAASDAQVNETAECLVNDAITSAVAAEHEQPTTPVATAPQQAQSPVSDEPQLSTGHELSHTEPTDEVKETTEPAVSPLKTEPESSELIQPELSSPEHNEQMLEETSPVVDTNNTNVSDAEPADQSNATPANGDLQDAVFSKLAELDLTNGHPEQPVPAENGHEGQEGEVMINGE